MTASASRLRIEVAYAEPDQQWVVALELPEGSTVREAIDVSGVLNAFESLKPWPAAVGLFGRLVEPETPLSPGDRVEIYRPLMIDPREARRQRTRPTTKTGRR
jgi:putative ubiquitin-RnfH superfamily antitoxin RatB of RatAB toxin-antitoxin module